ncbi:hypothetical protein Mycch_3379 [Mycolicibacterium chubuense NBB4]|uniref:PknH-like extracellular domain-containing protein n=1 Tax=Mycolicibacterium chubuense (strain NBB4) TaxID=710421 RepID=I4BLG2_MYCCN|nr:sensor domain-containing protein [Mycolicibacterium chubuense]AFM18119.1 hypothetical protein Mycch_3379 [Mycolicibacterium chubuense NBB4]
MSGKLAALVAGAGACVLLAGCSAAPVDQRPVLHIAEAAKPSPAVPLGRFLPDALELSAALGTGPAGFTGQLVQGDGHMLLDGVAETDATPAECVGAAYRLQRSVYNGSPVQSVATNSWAGGGFDGPPVSGFFGVVQMTSAVAAQQFFAAATDRWRRCDGETLARHGSGQVVDELSRITDVVFDRRVVSASVLHASDGTGSPTGMRALGVAGDCIVEVELTDPRPSADTHGAAGVANLILDKITTRR